MTPGLVGGGDTDSGSRIVVPHLRASGISHLQGLVISHADKDHSGGAISVLDNVKTDWLLSSLPDDSPIVAKSKQTIRCMAGQRWEWDGVHFEVLHPSRDNYADKRKTNDRSCVVSVRSSYGTMLLPGDIEAPSEEKILEWSRDKLRADVLVAPHHGSRTSSTDAFVVAVNPKITIFTVGYRNQFRHPRPEIVAKYAAVNATAFRSDYSGAISVKMEEGGIRATAWREIGKRYWHDKPI